MLLHHDPLWPRAGTWHGLGEDPVDAALLGVPTWRTSITPNESHRTPTAVRDALRKYSPAILTPEPIDLEDELTIADAGNVPEPDGEEGEQAVRARVAQVLEHARRLIVLGGDNAATYSVAQGAAATGLITLDAHFDLRDGISNGSPVRRLIADGLDPARIVQIGIADFANSAAYARRAAEYGTTVITLDEVRERGIRDVIPEALEVAGSGAGGIHLDIDVDVCDRSVAPGCPAALPGGLEAWELRLLVRGIGRDTRVRSADIVEVDSMLDSPDERTVRLAALCVLDLLAGLV